MADAIAIVLHFRTAQRTATCVRSLQAAGVQRVIVVDNSADYGASLIELQPLLATASDLVVDVVEPGRNLGFGAGINLALSRIPATSTAPVLLINSDATLEPRALDAMQETLASGAVMTAPWIVEAGTAVSPVHHYHAFLALQLPKQRPGTMEYLTGACVLISADIARGQLFDPAFFFYGEDVELSCRLKREGHRVVQTDAALVVHEGSASARRGSMFYEYNINVGHWLLAAKLHPESSTAHILALMGRMLMLPARMLWRSISLRSLVPLKAGMLAPLDLLLARRRDLTPPAQLPADHRSAGA